MQRIRGSNHLYFPIKAFCIYVCLQKNPSPKKPGNGWCAWVFSGASIPFGKYGCGGRIWTDGLRVMRVSHGKTGGNSGKYSTQWTDFRIKMPRNPVNLPLCAVCFFRFWVKWETFLCTQTYTYANISIIYASSFSRMLCSISFLGKPFRQQMCIGRRKAESVKRHKTSGSCSLRSKSRNPNHCGTAAIYFPCRMILRKVIRSGS